MFEAIMGQNEDVTGAGDVGVRRVNRGEDGVFESNSEYSIVLPEVDKVAVIMLACVELTAVATASPVWSAELHLATVGAIAGLGGYNMAGRQRAAEAAATAAAAGSSTDDEK